MQQNINIDLSKMKSDVCQCGCPYWKHRYIIKRIPAFVAGNAEDIFQAVEYFACESCGRPHAGTKLAIPGPKMEVKDKEFTPIPPASDEPCPV